MLAALHVLYQQARQRNPRRWSRQPRDCHPEPLYGMFAYQQSREHG